MFISYGIKKSKIGVLEIYGSQCSNCNEGNYHKVAIMGRYAHLYWIPFFPVGKKAISQCDNCKKITEQKQFSPHFNSLYKEQKHKVKPPLWFWSGFFLIGIFIFLVLFVNADIESDPQYQLLEKDKSLMVTTPTLETDSISWKIKNIFDQVDFNDKNRRFKYLTKVKNDKALILIKLPFFDKFNKDHEELFTELIDSIHTQQATMSDKELYFMVETIYDCIVITPTYTGSERSKIYDFYEPITNQNTLAEINQ